MFEVFKSKTKAVALAAALFLITGAGSAYAAGTSSADVPDEKITINLASRILTLYKNGKKVYMYHICAGTEKTPTPVGYYSIMDKEENPKWIDPKDPKKVIESGEDNPLGYRWMQFNGTYGIHGTNKPESIGTYASNGCVRLYEENAEQLFDAVDIGTPVEVGYDRLVIERLDDGMVVYYIYPDGYERQPLDTQSVRASLAGYGLSPFLSDDEIAEKIALSDGNPTYLGRVYRTEVDGKRVSANSVERDGVIYVMALPVSVVTKTKVTWDMVDGLAMTTRGTVPGYDFGGKLYVDSSDMATLFGLSARLDGLTLKLETIPAPAPSVEEAKPSAGGSAAMGAEVKADAKTETKADAKGSATADVMKNDDKASKTDKKENKNVTDDNAKAKVTTEVSK